MWDVICCFRGGTSGNRAAHLPGVRLPSGRRGRHPLAASGGPVYVTQRGRKTAVLLSRLSFGRLRREHETLTRAAVGDLGVPLGEGLALDEIFTRGERALAGQRSVAAAECAAATVEEVDETDFNWPPAWCRTIGDE